MAAKNEKIQSLYIKEPHDQYDRAFFEDHEKNKVDFNCQSLVFSHF